MRGRAFWGHLGCFLSFFFGIDFLIGFEPLWGRAWVLLGGSGGGRGGAWRELGGSLAIIGSK